MKEMDEDNNFDQDDLTRHIAENAELCSNHFNEEYSGKLDFSLESISVIEEILDDVSNRKKSLHKEERSWLINIVGSYVFEVGRQNFGGKYYWLPATNETILITGQPIFAIAIIVFQKVIGRIDNGKDDSITFFFQGYVDSVLNAEPGASITYI